MRVKIPQFPWYGDTEFELDFPASWEVQVCHMAGENTPILSEAQMRDAFLTPIGTPQIAEPPATICLSHGLFGVYIAVTYLANVGIGKNRQRC